MNLPKPISGCSIAPTVMLACSMLVSGCSSTSNSTESNDSSTNMNTSPETAISNGNSSATDNITAEITENGTDNGALTEVGPIENNDSSSASDQTNEMPSGNPITEDVPLQSSALVSFDISVPYYLSDELRVELTWGDISLNAMWVETQSWSAMGDFPTQIEQPLTITFFDKNGAVELARYSESFTATGISTNETVTVLSEQFDAHLFDNDQDGVNNLDELLAGTDPFIDQDSLLEIVDTFALGDSGRFSRLSVSKYFEENIDQNRPITEDYESDSSNNTKPHGTYSINIDTNGNGTLDVNGDRLPQRFLPRLSATRANSDNSITWAGEIVTSDSEYVHRETFTNTVTKIDDNLRGFVQEITGRNAGTFQFNWESNADLTGELIENSSLCKLIAGTLTYSRTSNLSGHSTNTDEDSTTITTVSKKAEDLYWRIQSVNDNLQISEYFARELQILYDVDDEDSAYFLCDFVDFE